jgi:SAM-dependent methyltransferase
MYERLRSFLLCPLCRKDLQIRIFDRRSGSLDEIETGLLQCPSRHFFPIAGGIPRLLPDAMAEWESSFRPYRTQFDRLFSRGELTAFQRDAASVAYDRRTRDNFTLEWQAWEAADGTWGMTPEEQVRVFFLGPLETISAGELVSGGRVIVDAGCGAGMPSIEYARLGLEVIALDLSRGLEHGERARRNQTAQVQARLHFVQGDLMKPPLRTGLADIILSLGVLHHTPNTKSAFDAIVPVLKPSGVLSVWLYAYEPVVTPVVESIRAVTTAVPPRVFALMATVAAPLFRSFCWTANRLRLRTYPRWSSRAAKLALMDIFGATYAHWHRFDEVEGWFRQFDFDRTAEVARSRRGFGVIGMRGTPVTLPEPGASRASQSVFSS